MHYGILRQEFGVKTFKIAYFGKILASKHSKWHILAKLAKKHPKWHIDAKV
jgi:hypothetical protein